MKARDYLALVAIGQIEAGYAQNEDLGRYHEERWLKMLELGEYRPSPSQEANFIELFGSNYEAIYQEAV